MRCRLVWQAKEDKSRPNWEHASKFAHLMLKFTHSTNQNLRITPKYFRTCHLNIYPSHVIISASHIKIYVLVDQICAVEVMHESIFKGLKYNESRRSRLKLLFNPWFISNISTVNWASRWQNGRIGQLALVWKIPDF